MGFGVRPIRARTTPSFHAAEIHWGESLSSTSYLEQLRKLSQPLSWPCRYRKGMGEATRLTGAILRMVPPI